MFWGFKAEHLHLISELWSDMNLCVNDFSLKKKKGFSITSSQWCIFPLIACQFQSWNTMAILKSNQWLSYPIPVTSDS